MEVDKRKKRVIMEELDEEKRERLKKLKEDEGPAGDGGEGEPAAPSEEEVEEFFAILRRMQVAVKYFDERGRRGREALEQAEITVDEGENADDAGGDVDGALPLMQKKGNEEEEVVLTINNEVLDLNAVAPEAEENGGA